LKQGLTGRDGDGPAFLIENLIDFFAFVHLYGRFMPSVKICYTLKYEK